MNERFLVYGINSWAYKTVDILADWRHAQMFVCYLLMRLELSEGSPMMTC